MAAYGWRPALLATSFMHLLPEAFESQAGAKELFATLRQSSPDRRTALIKASLAGAVTTLGGIAGW